MRMIIPPELPIHELADLGARHGFVIVSRIDGDLEMVRKPESRTAGQDHSPYLRLLHDMLAPPKPKPRLKLIETSKISACHEGAE